MKYRRLIVRVLKEDTDICDVILCDLLEILDKAFVLKDLDDLQLKIRGCDINLLMLCLTSIS